MESNWAAEHLEVIRTLMERSAVYRRALAPIMILNGCLGLVAAIIGYAAEIESSQSFIIFWVVVAFLAMGGSFFLVRRQALKASEPFWSPPTRRVTQAMLPSLFAGGVTTLAVFLAVSHSGSDKLNYWLGMVWLPIGWVILYGCAFHAAGFFMPRGMRLFGWALIVGGCALFAFGIPNPLHKLDRAYGTMGLFFGVLHLAYGIYLYFTEKRRNEA